MMNRTWLLLVALVVLLVAAKAISVNATPGHSPQPQTTPPPPPPTIVSEQHEWSAALYATITAGLYTQTPTAIPATPTAIPATPTAIPMTPTPTTMAEGPTTTTRAGDPVRMVIESLGMDRPLIPVGLDANQVPIVPKHDVGWYIYSAGPGQGENIVLWGHVLRFRNAPHRPAPFANLSEAAIGTPITLYNGYQQPYQYVITSKQWVTPDQVAYILPQGKEVLTLVSCIGDQVIVNGSVEEMTHRLITIAEPVP